jgi:hypothetical protein
MKITLCTAVQVMAGREHNATWNSVKRLFLNALFAAVFKGKTTLIRRAAENTVPPQRKGSEKPGDREADGSGSDG